jgi:hypothetical protein
VDIGRADQVPMSDGNVKKAFGFIKTLSRCAELQLNGSLIIGLNSAKLLSRSGETSLRLLSVSSRGDSFAVDTSRVEVNNGSEWETFVLPGKFRSHSTGSKRLKNF